MSVGTKAESGRIVRWWRARALRDLQAAFLGSLTAATMIGVSWVQLFRYPEDDFISFLSRAPVTVAGIVAPALLCVAFWVWLRTGRMEPASPVIHRLLIQRIARSPLLLVSATILAIGLAAGGLASILNTRAVSVRLIDPSHRTWRVYPRCNDASDPMGQCAAPRDVTGNSVVLRLARRGNHVVIESTDADGTVLREARSVEPNGELRVESAIPPIPAVDPTKVLVFLFSPGETNTPERPTHFAEDVIAELGDVVDRVQLVAPTFAYDSHIIQAWAKAGVRPFLIMESDYDGVQLRVRFVISQTDFAVSFATEASASSFGLSVLPFRVRMDQLAPQRFAVAPTLEARMLLNESYPRNTASTIRLILGIKALAESSFADALVLLKEPIDGVELNRPGDEALRAALAAVAFLRTNRLDETAEEIGRAVVAFRHRSDRTKDVVVTGDLAKRLPRLLAVAHGAASGRLFGRLLLRYQAQSKESMARESPVPSIFKEVWGEQWIAVLRFGEEYQYYLADEALRGMPAEGRARMEAEFEQSMKAMVDQPEQRAAVCTSIPLPDGSTYRPSDAFAFLARNLSTCSDCSHPRWFLEPYIYLAGSCR